MYTYQTTLDFTPTNQRKKAWAFAADRQRLSRNKKRTFVGYKHCVITACSKEAKALGVKAGMRYEEARLVFPDIKILVIGDKRYE